LIALPEAAFAPIDPIPSWWAGLHNHLPGSAGTAARVSGSTAFDSGKTAPNQPGLLQNGSYNLTSNLSFQFLSLTFQYKMILPAIVNFSSNQRSQS
jgi:hypothetical protein